MAIRTLSDTASGCHTFLCKFWRFKIAVSQWKLAWLTPNLWILWISVCSFWLCESIVANPIIYRLVPRPSRFEIRQWFEKCSCEAVIVPFRLMTDLWLAWCVTKMRENNLSGGFNLTSPLSSLEIFAGSNYRGSICPTGAKISSSYREFREIEAWVIQMQGKQGLVRNIERFVKPRAE